MFVFAILIAAVGVFQVTIVPQTNEEIEFKHSTQVRGEMQDVRSTLLRAGSSGTPGSVTVQTGVSYPSRSFTVNPGDPQGQLRTTAPVGAVNLTDVTASDPEAGDFWNGTHNFTSRSLVYRPDYNYYDDAPAIIYEPTVLYRSFPSGGEIVDGSSSLVDGRSLNVVLLTGEVANNGAAATVEAKPISASSRTVRIEDPGYLVVKSRLSESAWQELLADEPATLHSSSDFTGDSPNTVVVDLDPGAWTLNVADVSVGREPAAPGPSYLEAVGSRTRILDDGEATELTVRVLDRYGNPVEGVLVNQTFAPNRTTNSDGVVTYEYDSASGDASVDMWVGSTAAPDDGDDDDDDAARLVTFDVDVRSSGIDGFGDLMNPSDGLIVQSATVNNTNPQKGVGGIDVTFEATDSTVTVESFRVNYYHANGQGTSESTPPEEWSVNGSDRRAIAGESLNPDDSTVSDTRTFAFEFYWGPDASKDPVADSDLVVVTVQLDGGASRIYFISPSSP